jgi:glucose-1-phosphate thymidylyltransferase
MKGIILAGGKGTRLYPSTIAVSKQLLPVYDKPMIYYPLSVLLMLEIKDILIISTKKDITNYRYLLGDGKKLGINISYSVQKEARGIVDAFIIGKQFIGKDNVCLILGDNIFYGDDLSKILNKAKIENEGATIFGYRVKKPENFGVVQLDASGKVVSIEEKPKNPQSNYAVPGLYFYNNDVIKISKQIEMSERKELEITSLNNEYLKNNNLKIQILDEDNFWIDAGTSNNLLEVSNFVKNFQLKQKKYIACIEEISWKNGFINNKQLKKEAEKLSCTDYGKYIFSILGGDSSE